MTVPPSDEERHDPSSLQLAAATAGFFVLLVAGTFGMAATVGDIDPDERGQAWMIVGIVFLISFTLIIRALWNKPFARKNTIAKTKKQNITALASAAAIGGAYVLARVSPWAEVAVIPIPAGLVAALFVRFAKALVTKRGPEQRERLDLY